MDDNKKIEHFNLYNALKMRAVNVYATVKQIMQINYMWYAHILFYLVAHVYACTCTSAKAQTMRNKRIGKIKHNGCLRAIK